MHKVVVKVLPFVLFQVIIFQTVKIYFLQNQVLYCIMVVCSLELVKSKYGRKRPNFEPFRDMCHLLCGIAFIGHKIKAALRESSLPQILSFQQLFPGEPSARTWTTALDSSLRKKLWKSSKLIFFLKTLLIRISQ